jgi:hypothetical protein
MTSDVMVHILLMITYIIFVIMSCHSLSDDIMAPVPLHLRVVVAPQGCFLSLPWPLVFEVDQEVSKDTIWT